MKIKDIADIRSGVYLNTSPLGTVTYLQIKDLMPNSAQATAMVDYKPKMENNLLKKGDVLFAGKGTTYLCTIFNQDIQAVASTTLYIIRLHSNVVSPEFLCWYLNRPQIANEIKASQIGSSTPLILKSTLENIEIPTPSKAKQTQMLEITKILERETYLQKAIIEKRNQIVNQILINEINK